jgi:hypothetical protein
MRLAAPSQSLRPGHHVIETPIGDDVLAFALPGGPLAKR